MEKVTEMTKGEKPGWDQPNNCLVLDQIDELVCWKCYNLVNKILETI